MAAQPQQNKEGNATPRPQGPHRRVSSGSGLFSRIPFMRSPTSTAPRLELGGDAPSVPARTLMDNVQHKTRRRRGSLRKVALLGRGAQHEKRDTRTLTIDTAQAAAFAVEPSGSTPSTVVATADVLSLKAADLTPRPSMDGYASRTSLTNSSVSSASASVPTTTYGDSGPSYTSTTDEEDVPQIPLGSDMLRSGMSMSSGSESYFAAQEPSVRRRSFHQTKSPLSYSGLTTTPLPPPDTGWDYSETEWWGWVVLTVTWLVFVVGMGSCLDVWSWAWDVGRTPYAPPELEDDPTLPIVGYYPALMILTCIMAWVWVVVAWVGMKYFRHAKISGD
ncbi:hypothetical protein S7711_08042 [Stachybotrys chartarum IBT 7711]|uniref:Uncharacterized protein n=1 Tax=Stachybotrys chartarum (strain CBS 109288 / IBT 7711) TaxID=1280523 RepID=A0A084AML0_STACB|nr:hypothetical protein S7711_08042 [Stachybotrys chartarum IBT 7711]